MQITCNVSRERFDHKPDIVETARLQGDLKVPETLELSELARILVTGGNMRITACNGGSGDQDFQEAWLIGLDCDNKAKINGQWKVAENLFYPDDVRRVLSENGIQTAFQYYTWGNSQNLPKFRTIIALDEPILIDAEYRGVLHSIASLFDEFHCDRQSETVSRIFYGTGTGKTCFEDFTAVTNTKMLLSRSKPIERTQNKSVKKRSRPRKTTEKSLGHNVKPTKTKDATANQRVIDAIEAHDVRYLKRHIGNRRKTFDTQKELYDFIYRIPLDDFLDVTAGTAFRCILPDHEDVHPSASVVQTSFGIWKYKCHADCLGNGTALNIKQLIEAIGCFDSEYKAIEFICNIFNLRVKKTAWSEEQRMNIDRILNCITTTDGEDAFCNICPTAAKVTRNAINTYIQILCQAKNTLYPEKAGSGDIIFFLSIRKLAVATGKKSAAQVQGYVKQLIYCRMLNVLSDQEIPQGMLKRAIETKGEGHKRTAFYSIPSWVLQRVQLIEQYGIRWKENNYRVAGISYEMFYRNEPAEAARLYPDSKTRVLANGQTVERTTTLAADKKHEIIADFVLSEIEKHGYCTETMIINAADSHTLARTQIARSMNDICNCYGLKKCRCNKALKELYGIQQKGYPVIIVKADGGEKTEHR